MMYVYILLIKQAFYQKSSDIKDKIKKQQKMIPRIISVVIVISQNLRHIHLHK